MSNPSVGSELRYSIGVELARFSEHPSLISMDKTTDIIEQLAVAFAKQEVAIDHAHMIERLEFAEAESLRLTRERDEAESRIASKDALIEEWQSACGKTNRIIHRVHEILLSVTKDKKNKTIFELIHVLEAQLAHLTRQTALLMEFVVHDRDCILSQYHAGRSKTDGGYECLYGYGEQEKWYDANQLPECECGLDNALKSHTTKQEGA